MDDPRFRHVATDPRFKSIPKRARKVTIDSRFHSMFSDKNFKVKYSVDKRGRRSNQTSTEDLRKYYELDAADGEGKSPKQRNDVSNLAEEVSESDSDDVTDPEGDSPSSSSSESGDEEVVVETEEEHKWAEPDSNITLGEDTSCRLALCNMDWDHITAEDIFVLVSSFKPRGGAVNSVTIYPSDFGLQRMSQEDIAGPIVLLPPQGDSEGDSQLTEGSGYSQEKLREYQLNRFKYYYAVVVCDSVSTAEQIYEQCERVEYEHSGGCLDLRFIPDDMQFGDREPKSVTMETTLPADYTPTDFISSALQQTKVSLTWDETDSRRLQSTTKSFTKEDLSTMDFSAYLASSDSEGGEDGEGGEGSVASGEGGEVTKTAIDKYRALLLDMKETDQDDKEEIEITWEPGLKETATELVRKKKAEKSIAQLNVWEKRVHDKKQKMKERKRQSSPPQEDVRDVSLDDGGAGDLGFNDPFFQHDVATTTARSTQRARKSKLTGNENNQAKVELELLMADGREESGKQHFNLKDLLKGEKESNKKKKRKRSAVKQSSTDSFQVDVDDPRFSALYHSHSFAPDPTHPQYKATRGMDAIMSEKKRRRLGPGGHQLEVKKPREEGRSMFSDPSVGLLVKSVRAKTTSFTQRQKRVKS